MRKRLTLGSILFLTSVMLAFQNCAKHEDNPISEAELLSLKVQEYNVRAGELFNERCSACHSEISNLDLNSFEVQFLLDNNYIVKGDPQLSPLYVFMIDNHPGLIDEIKPELNSNDLAFLRDWILLQDPFYLGDDVLGKDYEILIPIEGGGNRTDGERLWDLACRRCHGNIATTDKRNRTDVHIRNAIADQPQMNIQGLRDLTNAQILSIVEALAD